MMCASRRLRVLCLAAIALFMCTWQGSGDQDTVTVVTWNIEHLGSRGRGLGGIGAASLPGRTDAQLEAIAALLRDDLKADIVALQEVGVSAVTVSGAQSEALEKIRQALGDDWRCRVAMPAGETPEPGDVHNLHTAFVWNSATVDLLKAFELQFPNETVGAKRLFDRLPLVGYFEAVKDGAGTNDFVLTCVHLASGQDKWQNHLAACIIIEQNLPRALKFHEVKEQERVILGDFNDNPYAVDDNGDIKYSDLLPRYMRARRYNDLVRRADGFTRMNSARSSIIDHVFRHTYLRADIMGDDAHVYHPADMTDPGLAQWRLTYSDHFPVYFDIKVDTKDRDKDWGQ